VGERDLAGPSIVGTWTCRTPAARDRQHRQQAGPVRQRAVER
jgi:hypothetical protein